MNTEHISPRMIEAGTKIVLSEVAISDTRQAAEIAERVYLAMRAKHIESLGGGE